MTPHKHAEVLRQIADGVPLSEFEVKNGSDTCTEWYTLTGRITNLIYSPEYWRVRRKPQYIMVNGFKVPKPLDAEPELGQLYFVTSVSYADMCEGLIWAGTDWDRRMLERKIAHTTKETAIAHAKAMLGIDPKWEEA